MVRDDKESEEIITIGDKWLKEYLCEHTNLEYQPEEKDTNTPESLTCEDCGKDIDIPEPDYDNT